ncbi:MAG: DNA helicase RecQ [Desulfocapsa sp.]|nr:MAG: DNA helicase RecQ [Desulfocapsa sp.]
MTNITALLQKHFGYHQFRPLQKEIIENFSKGKDAVVLMPTGGGKSLCFQLPALSFEGLTLVISPLIALMKDQVDALNANGITAAFWNSSLNLGEQSIVKAEVEQARLKLLYIAPERIASEGFLEWLVKQKVAAIAVDEAHCISQWGHDFRPDYRNLHLLRQALPDLPVMALTASATPQVKTDIIEQLNLDQPQVFHSSFYRDNLHIRVIPKRNELPKIVELLKEHKGQSVIIYCFSRKDTEELASILRELDLPAAAYHAGMNAADRNRVQEEFIRDEINIITATIAFGMGIDKPDVRLIIHRTFPKTMEGYYQEIGRAGRDGLPCDCVLLYSAGDKIKLDYFLKDITDFKRRQQQEKQVREVMNYAESRACRWRKVLDYFSEEVKFRSCDHCDVCAAQSETFDATQITQKILSAIIHTGNRFGMAHVLHLLRGSKREQIISRGHEKLSVWGIVKEYTMDELNEIFAQLVERKLIAKNEGEYPTFKVTATGIALLKNRTKIKLPKIKTELSAASLDSDDNYNHECFEQLRKLRKQLANQRNVPPYVIFTDKSLREMATYFPQTKQDFANIEGVGKVKLDDFSELFITELKQFLTENQDCKPQAIPHAALRSARTALKIPTKQSLGASSRIQTTKELLAQEKTTEEIAAQLGLQPSTIVGYIEKLVAAGEEVEVKHLLPEPAITEEVKAVFTKLKTTALSPVYKELKEKYSYDVLRLVRLIV